MPRKRTSPRRRQPNDFGQISKQERLRWFSMGPLIKGRFTRPQVRAEDVEEGEIPAPSPVTVWQSWREWSEFYATVRVQFLAEKAVRFPLRTPAAERLYQAIERGDDPEAEEARMAEEQRANDPRLKLGVTE